MLKPTDAFPTIRPFLKIAEVAKLAQVTPQFMWLAIRNGDGPRIVRFGRAIRIRPEDFEEWASANPPSRFKRKWSTRQKDKEDV